MNEVHHRFQHNVKKALNNILQINGLEKISTQGYAVMNMTFTFFSDTNNPNTCRIASCIFKYFQLNRISEVKLLKTFYLSAMIRILIY